MTELNLYGANLFGDPIVPPSRGKVSDNFVVPPFSVLNSRDGFWQERKRMWKAFGIKGEAGRNAASIHCPEKSDDLGLRDADYTSIFDPVLTELVYTWFCPTGGQILDPFAGGSVRGIVASLLGYKYWGCDLSQEQIAANIEQGNEICKEQPSWAYGDSMETIETAPDADLIFSCPPYGDLEKYSDDPRDLSNMEYHTFIAAYKRIILRACKKLKPNRFVCFVVGDFRDSRGFYHGFVADTIAAFREQRLSFYNEAILVTSVGSASMRVTKQFNASRKFAKTHQNVLVFVKGDPREATRNINNVESSDVDD